MAPELLIYRLGDKLVYVRPADNYEQALDIAQKEFQEELAGVLRDCLSLSVLASENCSVRVSEDAWGATVAILRSGAVIEISVRPLPQSSDTKEPPQYLPVDVPPQTRLSLETPESPARPQPSDPSPARRSDNDRWRKWLAGEY